MITRERMIDLAVLAWSKKRDVPADLLPIAFASFDRAEHLSGIRDYFKRLAELPADLIYG